GTATRVTLALGHVSLTALLPKDATVPSIGSTVRIGWQAEDLHKMAAGQ
ncbi:MAG: TOBE domain-containing protein, partial [Paracoccaceae bacterium]